ncbi:MAG: exo-alpha-sialidase [Armatimonadetes bacterium]|nr:exo-alpha-sialidase [Armatimonadota bacterium]
MNLVRSEFIYVSAPFPSCHASTIVQTRTGKILAAWFGGTAESNPDVGVYVSELQGDNWTVPKEVAVGYAPNGERRPCYNPVLFQPSGGPILLFYKVGTGPQGWWGMLTKSTDDGRTWDKPVRLPDGILGPIKNKPMELPDHTLICPSSTEEGGWRVHFEFTKDFGKTWTKTDPVNDGKSIGAIQPSLLKLPGGKLRAVGRTQQGRVFSIDSNDKGKTWGPMSLTDVPNPNSGCDAITLKDGRHLMVYNNTPSGRTPLCVAISSDAKTWTPVLTLESDPGEYSYPSLIQTKDGLVHIVYTWQRKRIKHAVVAVKK